MNARAMNGGARGGLTTSSSAMLVRDREVLFSGFKRFLDFLENLPEPVVRPLHNVWFWYRCGACIICQCVNVLAISSARRIRILAVSSSHPTPRASPYVMYIFFPHSTLIPEAEPALV